MSECDGSRVKELETHDPGTRHLEPVSILNTSTIHLLDYATESLSHAV